MEVMTRSIGKKEGTSGLVYSPDHAPKPSKEIIITKKRNSRFLIQKQTKRRLNFCLD